MSGSATFALPNQDELNDVLLEVLSVMELSYHLSPDGDPCHAMLTLDGPAKVQLYVEAERPAAEALSQSFFGETGPEANRRDAVSELANIMAGALKVLFEGSWHIGIPTPNAPESFDDWVVTTMELAGAELKCALGLQAQ